MNDPISDMLTRIRNALAVGKFEVRMPYSKMKHTVADQIKVAGFIDEVKINKDGQFPELVITMHDPETSSRITNLERVSKPGRRLYAKSKEIPKVLGGRGVMIISTSKGLLTDREARRQNIGGELICKVW
ncbi:30S ribosomal protein S8 [Candidatus Saccharibacteria bacterium]|jgi:small subunit ribosomal protein S8|nr:30S ribosomal protein S8 [Candidatus Saccharibacteria bacterium]